MIFEQFSSVGLIPEIIIDNSKDAVKLASILFENGFTCAEVSFRTQAAEEAIKIMTREFPDMLIGAGTIFTIEQAGRAINAGAKFIASHVINADVVQYCLDESVPITPGTQTPTEMQKALELGLVAVKFFPSEQSGGLNMIKAVSGVFEDLRFMPHGGINAKNLGDYLKYDKVIACVSHGIVRRDLIYSGEWDKIAMLVKETAKIVKEIRTK